MTALLRAPDADRVVIFQGQPVGINAAMTAGALGIFAMFLQDLPDRPSQSCAFLIERRNVGGRRGRWIVEQSFEYPDAAFYRRGARRWRTQRQNAALRQQAPARLLLV